MPEYISPEAWSNWGWKYANIYQPALPQRGGGQQQQFSYGQYAPNQLYVNPAQMGGPIGMPTTGVSQQDPAFWSQYLYPAALAAQQAQLRPQATTETKRQGAGLAGELMQKYGISAEGEVTPSQKYRLRSNWVDAMQRADESAMRSGMPISSVAEKSRGELTQNYLEGLNRAAIDRKLATQQLIMQFLQSMAG